MIRKEEPPYDFKIHLFLDYPKDDEENKVQRPNQRELTLKMMDKLESLGAKDIRDTFLKDNRGEKAGGKNSDKIRYTFTVSTEEDALKCYKYFIDRHNRYYQQKRNQQYNKRHVEEVKEPNDQFDVQEQIMIYLQKEEEVFVKYGDEEAELYN